MMVKVRKGRKPQLVNVCKKIKKWIIKVLQKTFGWVVKALQEMSGRVIKVLQEVYGCIRNVLGEDAHTAIFKLVVFYIIGILVFAGVYFKIVRKDETSLILTSDVITTNQIEQFINNNTVSKYDLAKLKEVIVEVINKDYSYQDIIVITKPHETFENIVGEYYIISVPMQAEGDTIHVEMHKLLEHDFDNLYINNIHGSIHSIGSEWGEYYTRMYLENGISTFAFEEIDEEILLYQQGQSIFPKTEYVYLKCNLYKHFSKDAYDCINIIIDAQAYSQVSERIVVNDRYNISDLYYFIQNSVIYIDNQVNCAIKAKNVSPGFWDCLYFSALSMITTGYGDVLPNSTCVRVVVMFEILYGLVIMGLIMSYLYDGIKDGVIKNSIGRV